MKKTLVVVWKRNTKTPKMYGNNLLWHRWEWGDFVPTSPRTVLIRTNFDELGEEMSSWQYSYLRGGEDPLVRQWDTFICSIIIKSSVRQTIVSFDLCQISNQNWVWNAAPWWSKKDNALAPPALTPVSYTHLDVYKRQVFDVRFTIEAVFAWFSIRSMIRIKSKKLDY